MKMLYFRHVDKITYKDAMGNDVEFDTSKLTLKDRLILSAYLTKISLQTKKSLAEIIFDYGDDEIFTSGNFKSFDMLVTDVIKKKYIGLVNWMDAAFAIDRTQKGARRFSIFAEEIDASDIFKKKNGRSGYSIDSIAWKAFVLASAASKYTQKNYWLKRVMILNWLNADILKKEDIGEKEFSKYKVNKTQTKRTIQKWLDEVDVDGEFKEEYFYIYGRKNKHNEEAKNETTKEDVIEEAEEAEEETPIDETSLETPEEKMQRYLDFYWRVRNTSEGTENWNKMMKLINDNYPVLDDITKIGNKVGLRYDELVKAAKGGYLDCKDGALKKSQAVKKLAELKDHILNAEVDDSWCRSENARKFAVGYAYKNWPWLMMLEA